MEHLAVVKILMILTGTWRIKLTSSSKIKQTCYLIYSVLIQTYYGIFTICLIVEVPILWNVDMEKVVENLGISILCIIIFIKTYICQQRKIVENIQHILEKEITKDALGKEAREIYNYHARYTSYLNICMFVYSSMAGVTLVFCKFILYGQLKSVSPTSSDGILTFDPPTPYIAWRPVNERKHYAAAFTIDVFSAAIGCTYNTITQAGFRNFGKYATAENDSEEEKYDTLKGLILEHRKVIRYVENLDESIKNLLLVEFTINSIQITSLLFQFLKMKADITIHFKVVYMSLMILQVFQLAWRANEIKEQSMEISQAVYDSLWYDLSDRIKKSLHIVMIRAQRPLTLSLGPFFILTNDTAVTSDHAPNEPLVLISPTFRQPSQATSSGQDFDLTRRCHLQWLTRYPSGNQDL